MSAVEEDTSPLKGPAPKALPEDTSDVDKNEDIMPLTSPGDQPVQFVPSNGDAKVEIGDAASPPAFVGLGKEELLKYANDPFWVRLRWFLFILFWVLWVAMLAGAIVIIVLAPKCAEKKAQPETYYELNLKHFAKDGKVADIGDEGAKYLTELGVTSVIISDVLKKDASGETLNFKEVDESVGTVHDFTEAVKKLKQAGLRILMTLIPNHSGTKHEWFTDTEHKFHDYYIRKPSGETFGSTWVTVDNKDNAWGVDPLNSTVRFLHQFKNGADLNFMNEQVVNELTGVFSFWKGKGVDAFVIPAASYIVEDLSKLDKIEATKNHPKNVEIIQTILNKQPDEPHSFVEVDGLNAEDNAKYLQSGIVPLLGSSDISTKIDQYSAGSAKFGFFKELQRNQNQVIRLSGLGKQNQDEANIIRLLAYTSNSSVILFYGDEVDGFDSKSNTINWETASKNSSTYTYLKSLAEIQRTLFGDGEGNNEDGNTLTYFEVRNYGSVIYSVIRSKKYVVIVHFETDEVVVDFGELLGLGVPETEAQAKIIIATPNAAGLKVGEKFTRFVTLPARSGVLLEKVTG